MEESKMKSYSYPSVSLCLWDYDEYWPISNDDMKKTVFQLTCFLEKFKIKSVVETIYRCPNKTLYYLDIPNTISQVIDEFYKIESI